MFNAANRKRPFKVVGASSSSSSSKGSCNDIGNDGNGGIDRDGAKSNIQDKKSSTPPTTIDIHGIEIHFPFKPYEVQRDYMAGVVAALRDATNALLESPTGTGKTLCLLCAALAWQRHEKGRIASSSSSSSSQQPPSSQVSDAAAGPNLNKPPVIIYASRTHSQLSQVVNELRNTRYRPKHAILGSREHMCVHPKVNPSVANRRSSNRGGGRISNDCNDPPAFSSSDVVAAASSSTDVNNGCNKLNKGQRKCQYRNNLDDISGGWRPPSNDGSSTPEEQPVLDMEDLVQAGKANRICPFYHTRSLLKDEPELIFVPYNYLFDRDARESTFGEHVNFDNAVLIFDEAHNLEEFASESSSFDITSADVAACVSEVQRALQYMDMLNVDGGGGDVSGGGLKRHNVLSLKSVFLRFEKYLADSTALGGIGGDGGGGGGSSHPGEYIFDIFEQGAGITHDNLSLFVTFVKQLGDFVMDSSNASSSGTPKLDHFLNCLKRAFGSGTHLLALARAKSYRVHVTKMTGGTNAAGGGGGFAGGRTISFWCFAPALAMRELSFLNVRSIIITSGTLSPLPSCAMELGLKFPVQLENEHVIMPDQIFVRVIGKGVSGKELSSKFGRRDDPEYITELGNTLASLCGNIPGGMLVFFPSYVAMEAAIQRWGGPASSSEQRYGGRKSIGGGGRGAAFFAAAARKKQASAKFVFPMVPAQFRSTAADQSSPWQRLLARKAIVLEPRSTSELSDAISEYKRFIAMPKSSGAILMGVCRGKISEGIDFSDDMCRAVIVTGLPFAPYLDPKVKLKREFLDAARASAKSRHSIDGGFGNGKLPVKVETPTASVTLSGAEWYNQQAHRACNQAIGRVIRHRHDYGAVLLLDHRFAEVRNRDGLSKWIRPHLRDETFGATTRGLVQFYRDSKAKADKAKAFQQSSILPDRPIIKYEKSDEAVNVFSKVAVVKKGSADDDTLLNGYIPENLLMERYDLNDLPANRKPEQASGEDYDMMGDRNLHESNSKLPSAGLSAFYSKERANPLTSHTALETKASSFEGIDKEPRGTDFVRSVAREQLKRRPQPSKKSDAAILQAKIFFTKAKVTLSKDDLLKVNKLLVAMKEYGDSKNEQLYVKSAKELVTVLADSQVDSKRIQMIGLLFPLLPVKYRYKIERMAAELVFDKSTLHSKCKNTLPDEEFSNVRGFVLSMIFNTSSSHDSIATNDREILEDSQRIIATLIKNEVPLNLFFDLLPERQLRKVQTLAVELERSQYVAKAKERSANYKGENCINTVLFRPPAQKKLAARDTQTFEPSEDAESQRIMSEALSQGFNVNRQRKDLVIGNQKKAESMTKPSNPYQRTALKTSRKINLLSATKENCHASTSKHDVDVAGAMPRSSANDQLDVIDRCLHQVKSAGFVKLQTRIERINGKIKAHVPIGMICMVCNESLKEPLMAESCRHSACLSCWTSWLKRSNTCPVCRAPTEMKDLSKLIFTKESGAPSLTQICASDDEGSDEEELEIVKD